MRPPARRKPITTNINGAAARRAADPALKIKRALDLGKFDA